MITSEFETYDQMEMAYLYDLGLPYEFDRSNPKKVIMIVKADAAFVREKLEDLWQDRNNFRRHYNAIKDIKRSLWVGGVYDKDFYVKEKQNANSNLRTPDKQEK